MMGKVRVVVVVAVVGKVLVVPEVWVVVVVVVKVLVVPVVT